MKAFIVCLSKIEASFKSGLRLQKQLQNFRINADLFEGSYGNVIQEEYNRINRKHHDWSFKGPHNLISDEWKQKQSTPGIIGCFDSQYRLWQKCLELNEPIMIFEDDADVIRPFFEVEFDDVLSLVFSHTKKMGSYIHLLENPIGEPTALKYKQSSMPGNAGYAIKPHAAKILVDEYKNSFLPADNAINQHLVKIQIHSHMMGKALYRDKTYGKSSLIKTRYWSEL